MNQIIIIAAVAKNGVIGLGGKIPWHIPEDLKRFKELTLGHPCIMGRKTYISIGKPLPARTNIVCTSEPIDGVYCYNNFSEALTFASKVNEKVFIIGGSRIYKEALSVATTLEITHVDVEPIGDTYFNIPDGWDICKEEKFNGFTFTTYKQKHKHKHVY